MKRYKRKTGPHAYAPLFEAMRGPSVAPNEPTSVDIVASTCTGLVRLSKRLGVNLHHIGCPAAVAQQAHELSLRGYGARVIADAPTSFIVEDGWRDWRLVPLQHEMVGGCPIVPGAKLRLGRLSVEVDASVSRAAFARRLALALDPMRFDVALTSGRAVAQRMLSGAVVEIAPRYAAEVSDHDWDRATQIYVFDPWRDLARLAALSSAAAIETLVAGAET